MADGFGSNGVAETLAQIAKQDYDGKIHVILIDNNSKDDTSAIGRIIGPHAS